MKKLSSTHFLFNVYVCVLISGRFRFRVLPREQFLTPINPGQGRPNVTMGVSSSCLPGPARTYHAPKVSHIFVQQFQVHAEKRHGLTKWK